MAMRVFIINTDYPAFLRKFYADHPLLGSASYAEQTATRNDSLFGVFDAYSVGFRHSGHEAIEVHANNGTIQTTWMKENGYAPPRVTARSKPSLWARAASRLLPKGKARQLIDSSFTLRPATPIEGWSLAEMLLEQVKAFRPDIVLNQSVSEVGSDLLLKMKPYVGKFVGQIASPLPDNESYAPYDMMISSLPNFVDYFRQKGIPAHLNRLGFDPRVLQKIGRLERSIDVSFVGSVSQAHADRMALLEYLTRNTDIAIWGGGGDQLSNASPIPPRHRGEAWGADMFRILGSSKITVNNHIGIAENFANNMRLYEATGMGALLVTDRKSNIAEIFEPGKEVVCYESAEECAELIRFYQRNDHERERIAQAGQRRTLNEHNYNIRTQELSKLFA
ncbi:glycosyltransferase [Rhizobium changzhiense]|uniref:CgeB family protein n=1 Tax=Rhizobium changzhiense TaxID=2692317 RepID=UPI001F0C29BF|nr:glycosyltransferase [Rhizobium changzhiense]MCH4544446.1 glycosyltransferase [Rhizobium changzhiense]